LSRFLFSFILRFALSYFTDLKQFSAIIRGNFPGRAEHFQQVELDAG